MEGKSWFPLARRHHIVIHLSVVHLGSRVIGPSLTFSPVLFPLVRKVNQDYGVGPKDKRRTKAMLHQGLLPDGIIYNALECLREGCAKAEDRATLGGNAALGPPSRWDHL